MKKLLRYLVLVFGVPFCLSSCFTASQSRRDAAEKNLYFGEDKSTAYFIPGKLLFTDSKENLELIRPKTVYDLGFDVPEDILPVLVKETYHSRLTEGIAIYRQDKKSHAWAKVAFYPLSIVIENLKCDEFVRITVRQVSHVKAMVQKYHWRSEKPNWLARWVLIVKISRTSKVRLFY